MCQTELKWSFKKLNETLFFFLWRQTINETPYGLINIYNSLDKKFDQASSILLVLIEYLSMQLQRQLLIIGDSALNFCVSFVCIDWYLLLLL